MTLFDRVKKIAKDRGLSLLQLNESAGLGKNAIYKWKKQKPSMENLQKVAKALHVSVDDLLDTETQHEQKSVDLNDNHVLMTFDGKPISDEDLKIIKRILKSGGDDE